VFDDIGCLLRDLDSAGLATEPSQAAAAATAQVWFLDSDQHWIPAPEAVFVRSPELETPMGGHVQAFADRAEAERAAAAVGGTVVGSFTELRAGAGAETRSEGGDDDSSG
jgi:nitrous oxide reductase accessory protein NosL